MASNAEIRAWARDNGWPDLGDKGRIPADARAAYKAADGPAPLPGPDDLDLGEIDLGPEEWQQPWPEDGLPARANTGTRGRREASQSDPGPVDGQPDTEITPDPPPGKLSAVPAKGKRSGRRPSAAVQQDIAAKVGIMLAIPGKVWEVRDPLCGGTFMRQQPEISAALTDIIMDSPDLVEWFTGTGGSFMKFFRLAAACMPVGTAVWAHHVVHSIEPPPADAQQPDYAKYAA